MNDDQPVANSAPSRSGRILGLTVLVAGIAVVAFLLGYALRPNWVSATALFKVSMWDTDVLAGHKNTKIMDPTEYQILKKAQVALLKSLYLLTAALRDPKIGSLPLIQSQSDPVEWLKDNLKVDFPEDGDILSISLSGTEGQEHDLVEIVDAISATYKKEVVDKRRMEQLASHDLLAHNLEDIKVDIKRKLDKFLDIARETGQPDAGSVQLLQQLNVNRLDRVEGEIMRLESALAVDSKADSPERKSTTERLIQLREQQSKFADDLAKRVERSADLEFRQSELHQLQKLAGEMSVKLQFMDIESAAPDHIFQVQDAIIVRK